MKVSKSGWSSDTSASTKSSVVGRLCSIPAAQGTELTGKASRQICFKGPESEALKGLPPLATHSPEPTQSVCAVFSRAAAFLRLRLLTATNRKQEEECHGANVSVLPRPTPGVCVCALGEPICQLMNEDWLYSSALKSLHFPL